MYSRQIYALIADLVFFSPELNWRGVERLVSLITHEAASSEEGCSACKEPLKAKDPVVVLRTMTILDTLVLSCPQMVSSRLAARSWTHRFAHLAVTTTQASVRQAVLQLMANWAFQHTNAELSAAYDAACEQLKEQHACIIPVPMSHEHRALAEESIMEPGIDFEAFFLDASPHNMGGQGQRSGSHSPHGRNRLVYLPEPAITKVPQIKAAVKELLESIQMVTETAQSCRAEESNEASSSSSSAPAAHKSSSRVAAKLAEARHAADHCSEWADQIETLLMEDMPPSELHQLLHANDLLNAALQRWQALLALGVDDLADPSGAADVNSELLERLAHDPATAMAAERSAKEAQALRDQLEDAKRRVQQAELAKASILSQASADRKAALATARAEHARALADVKAQAVTRVKELMHKLEEHEAVRERLKLEKAAAETKLAQERKTAQARLEREVNTAAAQAVSRAASPSRPTTSHRNAEKRANEAEEELSAALAETVQLQRAVTASNAELADWQQQVNDLEETCSTLQAQLATMQEETKALRERLAAAEAEVAESNDALRLTKEDAAAEQAENNAALAAASAELQELRDVHHDIHELRQAAADSKATEEAMRLELRREAVLRKKAYNQIRELKGNIRVLARVRPAAVGAQSSLNPSSAVSLEVYDEFTLQLMLKAEHVGRSESTAKRYEYDTCFGPEADQQEVYLETKALIQSAFDGYNVCVFAYGQTGSGKTHTLVGDTENANTAGIVPRAAQDIFAPEDPQISVHVSCTMLELYQDDLLDLFGKRSSPLSIKRDVLGAVQVEGAHQRTANTAQELLSIFQEGMRRRSTAATQMNFESSRSHLIFTINLRAQHQILNSIASGKLTFVDLAGSERVEKSGSVENKQRFNEAKAINKSLTALGDVVAALTAHDAHVPYRNSKLTQLMSDSLGGSAKTLMIVNVSPLTSDASETRSSLDYALRVKQVKLWIILLGLKAVGCMGLQHAHCSQGFPCIDQA
ncbi:hypothetical protein WJX74_005707 [Apatococcus lobatus]|uniref:Kinesin-like protein n=1 Tax=Apatococcus lobatus TaxID=904363 RepID=A0AAW1RJ34_9CHLO